MNSTDTRYSAWLAQQSHLPFRAYGMDFSKYKCQAQDQSFQKQQGHENMRRAAVSELSKRHIGLGALSMSTVPPEPASGLESSMHEHSSRSPSYRQSIWRNSLVSAPSPPPRLLSLPRVCPSQPILCFPLEIPILSSFQLPSQNPSFFAAARGVGRTVDRGQGIYSPMHQNSLRDLVNGHNLTPRSASPDKDFENVAPESYNTQKGCRHCNHCRETFSRSLTHQNPSSRIFTRGSRCEDESHALSLKPVAHESRSHDSMPYHRLIKDIDFQDEIFIPNFINEDPRLDSSSSSVMTETQYQSTLFQGYSSHQRSATADSGVSFSMPLNDPSVEKWRCKTSNKKDNINNNGNGKSEIVNSAMIHENENRKDEILNLPRWRPITPTTSISSQTSTLTVSSASPPTPHNQAPWHESCLAAETASQIRVKQLELMAKHGPGIFQPFIPSRIVLEEAEAEAEAKGKAEPEVNPHRNNLSHPTPFSFHHHHHHHHPYLTPLMPASQNTALWLTGIPSTAHYSDILPSIRGGRVYICALNPPVAGAHATSACKLVFFTRAAAEAFFARAHDAVGPGVCVEGERVRCVWNRILYPEYRHERQSRVLVIRGEARLMSLAFFDEFFRTRFKGDVEARFEVEDGAGAGAGRNGNTGLQRGWKTYVWRFASLRAQAELAKVALEREMSGIFQVEYGADPCERPW